MVGGMAAFAAVVLAGYVVPLAWTGFPGNTLWDWLQLVLLPLVVAAGAASGEPGDTSASARRCPAARPGLASS